MIAAAIVAMASWGAGPAPRPGLPAVRPRPAVVPARHPRPLVFEATRGATDTDVSFVARGDGYTVFLTGTGTVLMLNDADAGRTVVRLAPIDGNPAPRIVPEAPLRSRQTESRRGSPAAGSSARGYARVRYVGVYPGIDVVYYGGPDGLEYDFVLAAGADPGLIALSFEGVERVELDAGGALVARTAAGQLRQPPPVAYQSIGGATELVAAEYLVDADGRVRLQLGAYDGSRPLVIDPVLAYWTHREGRGAKRPAATHGPCAPDAMAVTP